MERSVLSTGTIFYREDIRILVLHCLLAVVRNDKNSPVGIYFVCLKSSRHEHKPVKRCPVKYRPDISELFFKKIKNKSMVYLILINFNGEQ